MLTYTAAQWERVISEAQDAKLCFKMTRDVEDDLLYCSGFDPVTVDAVDYVARAMTYDKFALGDPSTTTLTISIDDADDAIQTTWYDERFSGNAVLLTLLLKYKHEHGWTQVLEVDWKARAPHYTDSSFIFNLHAAVGFRPRFGLSIGTRAEFPFAPEPGASIRVGAGTASFGGGGGGGGGWVPVPWGDV
jgi:hypothetical protein